MPASDEVWFAIPSASVERCRAHLPAWRERGYKIAVLQNRERGDIPADLTVWSDRYPGWAASVNLLCREIVPASAPVAVTGGDDMLPDPNHDAHELLGQFLDRFPATFGVMQPVGDTFMHASEYCGSPFLGRAWISLAYNADGPMHPGYRHNWADHELHWVARALDALWTRPDLSHHHAHFSRTGEAPPDYWTSEVGAHDRDDVERFIARLALAFPNHRAVPPGTAGPIERDAGWFRDRYSGTAHRYWASRYANTWLAPDAAGRLAHALRTCADAGHRRVAIFGAGTATRESAAALLDPPVDVLAILDERPDVVGTRLWGFTVRDLKEAQTLGLDAVVAHARGETAPMEHQARAVLGPSVAIVSTQSRQEHRRARLA